MLTAKSLNEAFELSCSEIFLTTIIFFDYVY